jgi:hypothetical protein
MASRTLMPHHHLDKLLRGEHPANHYHWHHVLRVMEVVCGEETTSHVQVLRRVATFDGALRVHPSHGLSHALPPEEMLRMLAIQTLRGWHRTQHRDVIRHVAETSQHDVVAHVARHALKG